MTPQHFAILLLVCIAWGGHFTVMKLAMEGAQPFFYVTMRMGLVALILSPRLKWHAGKMPQLLLGGLAFGCLNYLFFFSGMRMTPASVGAVTIELYMPIATILSVIFLGETIGWRRGVGLILAFAGVVIVALSGHEVAADPAASNSVLFGVLLIVGGAFSEAVGAITIKKTTGIKPLEMLAWFGVVGVVGAGGMSLLFERDQLSAFDPEHRGATLGTLTYSVLVASLFGHATYYWLLQRVDVSILTGAGLMTTIIGVLSAALILGDELTVSFLIGGMTALVGVAIIVVRSAKKNADTAPVAASGVAPLPGSMDI
ncbi:DMT family transporter [Parvularcula sp. LCG005]|uniref:DMT family transporter n=1 Tax=Parvularcula sp. LCG005 TaxID=3078805 RepID=UPI002943F89F|nr:DMT family transporter [Parvularcula sp. LCG005]WOI52056.1 DMT family transporter [Parvularcula sp. LCG005]